jgi:4-amino-4-deoxy-L-arabinose transferase-like glycosyltransferase
VSLWSLWFGAGFTILTGLTGLYAYNTVAHDAPSHAAMTDHRNWAIVTISLFLFLAMWSVLRVRHKKVLGPVFVIGMVFAGGVLASTAWRGGEVVYRYGLGVMALPLTEEGHAHAEGEGHLSKGAPPAIERSDGQRAVLDIDHQTEYNGMSEIVPNTSFANDMTPLHEAVDVHGHNDDHPHGH